MLLCAATLVLWMRSYRTCDVLLRPVKLGDYFCITSEQGVFTFEVEAKQSGVPKPGWVYFDTALPRRWPRPGGILGFDLYHGANRHYVFLPTTAYRGAAVPHWFATITFALCPAANFLYWRRRFIRRRRDANGLCPSCGYDLRASHTRCPECGATTQKRNPQAATK